MCREDEEPEIDCKCDYCVGYNIGYDEGFRDGKRHGMNHANTFHGIGG